VPGEQGDGDERDDPEPVRGLAQDGDEREWRDCRREDEQQAGAGGQGVAAVSGTAGVAPLEIAG
jgi:hypothetical protein